MTHQRRSDFGLAAVLAAIALAVSPIGIERLTGRLELSPRITATSLTLAIFLLILAASAAMQGRARKIAFQVAAWVFPIVILAGLEVVAVAVHLADRIAPIEDNASLKNWNRWPAYLLSKQRWAGPLGDVRLYWPWRSDGIVINELGLRTAPPAPKEPGEWRIAVTGGSTTWGYRIFDADTIPAQLQEALRRSDAKVTVYNFGIEGVRINNELALLKHFRAEYGIDHVVFYTGGNDVLVSYLPQANKARGFGWLTAESSAFELIKAPLRLLAVLRPPSPQQLAYLDSDVLAPILRNNPLRAGIRAANAYCDQEKLRCDFILQPMIFTRKPPRGSEAQLQRNLDRLYPRLGLLGQRIYVDVLASGMPAHIHDFSAVLDNASSQSFVDMIHLNEAGNRLIAERIAKAIPTRQPPGRLP